MESIYTKANFSKFFFTFKLLRVFVFVFVAMVIGGCQYGVQDGQLVNAQSVIFEGEHPRYDEPIRILARNRETGVFELIGETWVWGIEVGLTNNWLWVKEVDFTALPNRHCYFGEPGTCMPPAGEANATVIIIDQYADPLFNMTPAFLFCVEGHPGPLHEAVAACGNQTSATLTIRIADSSVLN